MKKALTFLAIIFVVNTINAQQIDSLKTKDYYLNQSGKHLKSSIIFAGSALATAVAVPLVNNVFSNKDLKFASNDILLASTAMFTLVSLGELWCVATSLQKASKKNNLSFKASPVGASVAFRF